MLNHDSSILWQEYIGTYDSEYFGSVIEASDGDIVIAGTRHYALWIIKIEKNGKVKWDKLYSCLEMNESNEIIETSDNKYIILGTTKNIYETSQSIMIVKIGDNGDIIWKKMLDGIEWGEAVSATRIHNNEIAIVGSVRENEDEKASMLVLFIDEEGNIIRQKAIKGQESFYPKQIIATKNNKLVIVGNELKIKESGIKTDAIIVKINQDMMIDKCNLISDTDMELIDCNTSMEYIDASIGTTDAILLETESTIDDNDATAEVLCD